MTMLNEFPKYKFKGGGNVEIAKNRHSQSVVWHKLETFFKLVSHLFNASTTILKDHVVFATVLIIQYNV